MREIGFVALGAAVKALLQGAFESCENRAVLLVEFNAVIGVVDDLERVRAARGNTRIVSKAFNIFILFGTGIDTLRSFVVSCVNIFVLGACRISTAQSTVAYAVIVLIVLIWYILTCINALGDLRTFVLFYKL